jgi:hypothetical protein
MIGPKPPWRDRPSRPATVKAWPWLAGTVEQQCNPDGGPAILASTWS